MKRVTLYSLALVVIVALGGMFVYTMTLNKETDKTVSVQDDPRLFNLGVVSLPRDAGWTHSKEQGFDSMVGSLSKDSVVVEYDSGMYSAGQMNR